MTKNRSTWQNTCSKSTAVEQLEVFRGLTATWWSSTNTDGPNTAREGFVRIKCPSSLQQCSKIGCGLQPQMWKISELNYWKECKRSALSKSASFSKVLSRESRHSNWKALPDKQSSKPDCILEVQLTGRASSVLQISAFSLSSWIQSTAGGSGCKILELTPTPTLHSFYSVTNCSYSTDRTSLLVVTIN